MVREEFRKSRAPGGEALQTEVLPPCMVFTLKEGTYWDHCLLRDKPHSQGKERPLPGNSLPCSWRPWAWWQREGQGHHPPRPFQEVYMCERKLRHSFCGLCCRDFAWLGKAHLSPPETVPRGGVELSVAL
jgi:hypothetical protein